MILFPQPKFVYEIRVWDKSIQKFIPTWCLLAYTPEQARKAANQAGFKGIIFCTCQM